MEQSHNANESSTVDAVVVGAGPAGLTCAIMLSRQGLSKVVLLEKNPEIGVQNNQLAYTYILDQRGQRIFKSLDLMDSFKEITAPNQNLRFNIVKKDALEVSFESGQIVLRKDIPVCIFCDSENNLIKFKDKYVCKDCILDMKKM